MGSETEDCRKYAVRYYNIITNVGGKICRSVMKHKLEKDHRTTLFDYLTLHKYKIRKKLIDNQRNKVYPGNVAVIDAESFDITLMMRLFIEFIFAEDDRPNKDIMQSLDNIARNRVVDDLARVRCYRNKLHDIPDTMCTMTGQDFWKYVEELNQIFHRLENYYMTDRTADVNKTTVVEAIYNEIHADLNLEEDNIKTFMQKIDNERKETKEMETYILDMMEKIIIRIERKRRCKNLNAELPTKVFVKTKQYDKAIESLRKQKVIVLNGSPGEGKTTAAKVLLEEVSKGRRLGISSAKDMKLIADDVDAVLIDDMFGAGTFDKDKFRPWQNNLGLIFDWVNTEGKNRYVAITSRTYILKEAMKRDVVEKRFSEDMIFQLSSVELTEDEKLTILKNHFSNVDLNPFYIKKKRYNENETHDGLLEKISKLKSNESSAVFTVGFPECARLFSCNKELYKKGKSFFETPIEEIRKHISELCTTDEIYVAFFVLWAQETKTIKTRDLEQPIDETSSDILTPIKVLQYSPPIVLPKIRDTLNNHAHNDGLIKLTENEIFRFSHYVVRDAVGMIAFERNQTAAFALCDKDFIERYIVIEDIGHLVKLNKPRFDQLCSRILVLVTQYHEISENYLLFMSSLFENEDFCTKFFEGDNERVQSLLATPFRSCNVVLERFKYDFIKNLNLETGLLSFLLWQNEKVTFFAKMCLKQMSHFPMEEKIQQELNVALYIASALGLYDIAKFCIENGVQISSQMILIAYQNLKDDESSEIKKELLDLLKAKATEKKCFPDKDGYYPIHLAAFEQDSDFVEESIKKNKADADIRLPYLSKAIIVRDKTEHYELKNVSLYHIAVFEGNESLIKLLHRNKVSTNLLDSNGRSPFLYAIEIEKLKIVETLFAISKENGSEMIPDASGDTPLHVAIRKRVSWKDVESNLTFKKIALRICKESKGDLHFKNKNGESPLYVACTKKQTDVMEALLTSDKGFQWKERNLLHRLVKEKNGDAIEALLKCGFCYSMNNDEGKTPLDVAQEDGDKKIIGLFLTKITNQIDM